jgi:MFS family permease
VNICVSDLFSLRDRGLYFGIISVVWALASGVGPVLGGVFTQKARNAKHLLWLTCDIEDRWLLQVGVGAFGLIFL